jgi:hypothetical protein
MTNAAMRRNALQSTITRQIVRMLSGRRPIFAVRRR